MVHVYFDPSMRNYAGNDQFAFHPHIPSQKTEN